MLTINGAWYINQLPQHIVLELEDGSLTKVALSPFRELTDQDFSDYKGYHPRKCKGQPLPDYLYRFYGLEKNEESLSEVVRARVTPSEKAKLKAYAANLEPPTTESELIRECVKKLIK